MIGATSNQTSVDSRYFVQSGVRSWSSESIRITSFCSCDKKTDAIDVHKPLRSVNPQVDRQGERLDLFAHLYVSRSDPVDPPQTLRRAYTMRI